MIKMCCRAWSSFKSLSRVAKKERMKDEQEETGSYRTPWRFFWNQFSTSPPIHTLPLVQEKKVLGQAWSLHESSCNMRSWKALSSINVPTPAVLGLTHICTLIKGNPFNQKIWFAWLLLVWSLEHRQQQQRHLEVCKKDAVAQAHFDLKMLSSAVY